MPSGGAPRDAAEGPPSERSRASLSEDLRREVADARVRFEEAGLRAQAHRLLGDDAAAAEVLAEQERILADVQDRLGRVVSAAVVQRDAEQVLAEVSAAEPLLLAEPDAPASAPRPAERQRTPALAGVASMVAILGVATAAVLGLTRGLDGVEIAEVSADVTPEETFPADSPPRPTSSPIGPVAPGPADSPDGEAATATAPSVPADATVTDPADPSEDEPPPPGPAPDPDLDTVVADLIDAVDGLDDPPLDPSGDDTDPPEEVDASAPDVDSTIGDLLPGDDGQQGDASDGEDGFVPDGAAQ